MRKFRKVFSAMKIVLMLMGTLLLCNTALYSYPLRCLREVRKSPLRIPIGNLKRPNLIVSQAKKVHKLPDAQDIKVIGSVRSILKVVDTKTNKIWYLKKDFDWHEYEKYQLAEIFGVNTVPHGKIAMEDGKEALIIRDIDSITNGEILNSENPGLEAMLVFIAFFGHADLDFEHNYLTRIIGDNKYYFPIDMGEVNPDLRLQGVPVKSTFIFKIFSELDPDNILQCIKYYEGFTVESFRKTLIACGFTPSDVTSLSKELHKKTGIFREYFMTMYERAFTHSNYFVHPNGPYPDNEELFTGYIIQRNEGNLFWDDYFDELFHLDEKSLLFRKLLDSQKSEIQEYADSNNPYLQNSLNGIKENMKAALEYLEKNNKRVLLVFDEFQAITNFPEKNVEAILRTIFQECKNINFIFSCSNLSMMQSIFSDKAKPFYQSTQYMHLEEIEKNEYKNFIKNNFKKGKQSIDDSQIDLILEFCRRHTYYVQMFCNRLYSKEFKGNKEILIKTLEEILKENEPVYFNYKNLLTDSQWKLVNAVANEGSVKEPLSGVFIKKYNLKSSSSVQRTLDSLLKKETLLFYKNVYIVYDVFFSLWLKFNATLN